MKRKRVIALLLSLILVITPIHQVHAENLNAIEEIEDNTRLNEPVSEEDSESSETDEDTTEKNNDLDISENENKSEDISESDDEEKSEADVQNKIELEQSNEENLEEPATIQSIEPENSNEPEKPDDLNIGGYIESELDYNTPVYSSDTDTYADIPSSFSDDMEKFNSIYPGVRNQDPYGTCWAFSSMGLAEFDLINDSLNGEFDKDTDLSELQLAYFTYNSVEDPLGGTEGDSAKYYNENATESYLNYGGNYEMASRRLAQWYGPVKESLVPYTKAEDTIKNGLDGSYAFEDSEAHLENAYLINIKKNADDVKQQIIEHGAAGIMYYHNNSSLRWNETLGKYVYYDIDKSGGGHAVMIVGWDDDFSKDNFTGSSKPSKDGAWLVRNSWGDYASYFWMSYESASLADTAWVFDFSSKDGYDNNYQLDGGVETYPDKNNTTLANVFKTKQGDETTAEILSAVSLSFTHAANVSYTVDIYTDLKDETDPYSGIKQEDATTTGVTAYAGIYTISLENSVTLKPGTSFAVVVSVDSAVLDYEQATLIATGEGLATMVWDCQVSKGNNKSFYFSGGKFYPFYWGNYGVKAFTTDSDIEEPEEPQEKLEGLQEKDGSLYYFKNGEIDTTYTGTASYQGEIYYCENGRVAYSYTGFGEYEDKWYYFEKSRVAEEKEDIIYNARTDEWWYVKDGVFQPEEETVARNANGWYYIKNGVVDFKYTGVVKSSKGIYYCEKGTVTFTHTGFEQNEDKWYYFENSRVADVKEDIIYNAKAGEWWYVKDGEFQSEVETVARNANGWYYIKNGVVDFSYTGVAQNDKGIYYCENGAVTFTYNGYGKYGDQWYYFTNSTAIRKCTPDEIDEFQGELLPISSCTASYSDDTLNIQIDLGTDSILAEIPQVYIVQLSSDGTSIINAFPATYKDQLLVASISSNTREARSWMMNHYAAGIYSKVRGAYQQVSVSSYITNPEDIAEPTDGTSKEYYGFYEGKVESKKGMQGIHANAVDELGIQASLVNIHLNELIKTSANVAKNGDACYQPYVYKGKTYYFHDMISYQKTIYYLNGWGDGDYATSPYGSNRKNVSLNLLLGWDNELTYLIAPSARVPGKSYYSLNMTDSYARETFEALFCYMTEKLGGNGYKHRVCNWVLGNEVNACNAWNYAGGMSTRDCAYNYAKAFQLLYQAVRGTDKNARVFISLDHSWTVGPDGHSGKEYLDEFAAYMYATAPHMRWNVDYHPYSNPLYKNDFWNDTTNTTTDSVWTPYISMKNLHVLTDYLAEIENRYHMQNGYIRVILGEQGYIAASSAQEAEQAAAIAYEFYIASMNKRVDACVNRAYVDAPEEGIMTLGLMYVNEVHKASYDLYKNLGKAYSLDTTAGYAGVIGAARWEYLLPGLTTDSFYHYIP